MTACWKLFLTDWPCEQRDNTQMAISRLTVPGLLLWVLGVLRSWEMISKSKVRPTNHSLKFSLQILGTLVTYFNFLKKMYLSRCFAWMNVYWCVCSSCRGQKEGVGPPETGFTPGCELSHGCWKLNPGAPGEQPVLLTDEPYLQSLVLFCFQDSISFCSQAGLELPVVPGWPVTGISVCPTGGLVLPASTYEVTLWEAIESAAR